MFMAKREKKEEIGKKKMLIPGITAACALACILLVFGLNREI